MNLILSVATVISLVLPLTVHADVICSTTKDTSLFADAQMAQEDRMVFQYDGIQFVPEHSDGDTLYGRAYDVRMQQLLETPSYVRASDWACEDFPNFKASEAGGNGEAVGSVYDVSREACEQDLSDTRLEISDQSFTFYESSCDIADATVQGDATAYTLSCYGEGDTWDIRALLTSPDNNGINLTVDGNTTSYVACGE